MKIAIVTFPSEVRQAIVDAWKDFGKPLFNLFDRQISNSLDVLFFREKIAHLLGRETQRLFFTPEVKIVWH